VGGGDLFDSPPKPTRADVSAACSALESLKLPFFGAFLQPRPWRCRQSVAGGRPISRRASPAGSQTCRFCWAASPLHWHDWAGRWRSAALFRCCAKAEPLRSHLPGFADISTFSPWRRFKTTHSPSPMGSIQGFGALRRSFRHRRREPPCAHQPHRSVLPSRRRNRLHRPRDWHGPPAVGAAGLVRRLLHEMDPPSPAPPITAPRQVLVVSLPVAPSLMFSAAHGAACRLAPSPPSLQTGRRSRAFWSRLLPRGDRFAQAMKSTLLARTRTAASAWPMATGLQKSV